MVHGFWRIFADEKFTLPRLCSAGRLCEFVSIASLLLQGCTGCEVSGLMHGDDVETICCCARPRAVDRVDTCKCVQVCVYCSCCVNEIVHAFVRVFAVGSYAHVAIFQ